MEKRATGRSLQPHKADERVAHERRPLVNERLAVIPEAGPALLVQDAADEPVLEIRRGRFRIFGGSQARDVSGRGRRAGGGLVSVGRRRDQRGQPSLRDRRARVTDRAERTQLHGGGF